MSTKDKQPAFITLNPIIGGKIRVNWGYVILHKKEEGRLACVIPSFKIHFTANDIEHMREKSGVLCRYFFDYYFTKNPSSFVKQLHYLGFKTAENDLYIKSQLAHKKPVKAKFKNLSSDVPYQFENGVETEFEDKMEVEYA